MVFARPLTTLLVAALAAGCAARVPVAIDVEAVVPAPRPGEIVPRFVELWHADEGWIHVDLSGADQLAGRLEQGIEVQFATTSLPRGRYESIRFGYLATASVPSTSAVRRWVPVETLVLRPFCIGWSDPHIVLEIARDPSDAAAHVTVDAPPCR